MSAAAVDCPIRETDGHSASAGFDAFAAWLRAPGNCGAVQCKDLGGGIYAAVKPLLFHWTMIVGQVGDECGYDDRFCYADRAGAEAALAAWDGTGDPLGWHRHPNTGRHRAGGDPGQESIAW